PCPSEPHPQVSARNGATGMPCERLALTIRPYAKTRSEPYAKKRVTERAALYPLPEGVVLRSRTTIFMSIKQPLDIRSGSIRPAPLGDGGRSGRRLLQLS